MTVELREMDTDLLEVLREAGDRWGPAGVARAAAALASGDIEAPTGPGPVVVEHSVRTVLGGAPQLAGAAAVLARAATVGIPDWARLSITRESGAGWVFTWVWSSPAENGPGLLVAAEPDPWVVRLDPYPEGPYPGVIPARHGAGDE